MSTTEKVGVAKVSLKSFYSAWAPAGASQGSNSFFAVVHCCARVQQQDTNAVVEL